MAILTGGTVFSSDAAGTKLEKCTAADLGSAGSATVTKDDCIFLSGGGEKPAIDARADEIREAIRGTSSDYEREKLQERLAKIRGGVAVIKVGGTSEVEVGEKKDRYVDALNATRAAVEEGIVPGGGTALLKASTILGAVKSDNFDQSLGVDIIRKAILAPVKTIVSNAGGEGAVVAGHLIESYDGKTQESFNYGASRL